MMNRSTLHQFDVVMQPWNELCMLPGRYLRVYLHDLIREYKVVTCEGYTVNVNDFSLRDKRILLSHFESAEDYEYACTSVARTEALWQEWNQYVQELVNDEIDEVYNSDMREWRYDL